MDIILAKFKTLSLFFICVLITFGCARKEFDWSVDKTLFESFSKANSVYSGLYNGKKDFFEGKFIIPQDISTPRPLVIALHWAGPKLTYEEFSSCLIEPALLDLDAYLIVPESNNEVWNSAANEANILNYIKRAKKYWNIDHNKIIVMGYSDGGNGSWYYAENYPRIFSAVIPMASSYGVTKKSNVPVYLIHGHEDELFDVNLTIALAKQAQDLGMDVTVNINAALTHFEACNYKEDLKLAIPWLNEKLEF